MELNDLKLLKKALELKKDYNVSTIFVNLPQIVDVVNKSETEMMLYERLNPYFKVLDKLLNMPADNLIYFIENYAYKVNSKFIQLLALLQDTEVKNVLKTKEIYRKDFAEDLEWFRSTPPTYKQFTLN